MKKISRRSFLTAMAAVSAAGVLTACGASSSTASSVASSVAASSEATTSSEAVPESVTIKAFNGAKELVDVEVPFDPQRIAILELASLDILDELGVGDRVVGTASTSLDYLQSYVTNDSIVNLGNIKEADMEAVMACEPDIIFIGGRLSKSYDALCEIAPVVFLATDAEKGVVESTRENAMTIASIFGLEDHVEALMADFDSRIDALKAFAEGKTAIVGMTTSGSFNVLGNDGRCSIIGKEIGFENIGVDANIDTSTHGNEASFEFIVDKNPDYCPYQAGFSSAATAVSEVIEGESQILKPFGTPRIGLICSKAQSRLKYNRQVNDEGITVRGRFLICGLNGDKVVGLSKDQADRYSRLLFLPQVEDMASGELPAAKVRPQDERYGNKLSFWERLER